MSWLWHKNLPSAKNSGHGIWLLSHLPTQVSSKTLILYFSTALEVWWLCDTMVWSQFLSCTQSHFSSWDLARPCLHCTESTQQFLTFSFPAGLENPCGGAFSSLLASNKYFVDTTFSSFSGTGVFRIPRPRKLSSALFVCFCFCFLLGYYSEARGKRQEARGRRQEAGGRRQEARGKKCLIEYLLDLGGERKRNRLKC